MRHHSTSEDDVFAQRRAWTLRRHRLQRLLGLSILLAGYGSLAISPDTPIDWVMLRVAAGFALLFIGFGVAIAPWIARITGTTEDE